MSEIFVSFGGPDYEVDFINCKSHEKSVQPAVRPAVEPFETRGCCLVLPATLPREKRGTEYRAECQRACRRARPGRPYLRPSSMFLFFFRGDAVEMLLRKQNQEEQSLARRFATTAPQCTSGCVPGLRGNNQKCAVACD